LFLGAVIILITRFTLQHYMVQDHPRIPQKDWQKRSWMSLYTKVNLTLQAPEGKADSLTAYLDTLFSEFTGAFQSGSSLDSTVMSLDSGEVFQPDSLARTLLLQAEQYRQESGGLIHPGIGNLLRAWGLTWGQTPAVPPDSVLEYEVMQLQKPMFVVDSVTGDMVLRRTGTRFTFGAFAKGWIMERAARYLEEQGVQNFLLDIGGDMRWAGLNPWGKPWTLGLQNPLVKDSLLMEIQMKNPDWNAIATSGGYEKFFVDSTGKKHHHILDPRTGQSVEGKYSMTVIGKDAGYVDFLATWFFIVPVDSAMQWLQNNPGFEGVIVADSAIVSEIQARPIRSLSVDSNGDSLNPTAASAIWMTPGLLQGNNND